PKSAVRTQASPRRLMVGRRTPDPRFVGGVDSADPYRPFYTNGRSGTVTVTVEDCIVERQPMIDGLAITVLGDVDIRVDGKPIDVDTRKAVALVAYLAVTGTSASRDTLASLLWGELDSNRARGALRRTLSVLRKALDNRWLTVESDRVRLEREGLYLDMAEAEELRNSVEAHPDHSNGACADCFNRLERAAALYRGDFMAGFNLRDAPDFDNWQLREADA